MKKERRLLVAGFAGLAAIFSLLATGCERAVRAQEAAPETPQARDRITLAQRGDGAWAVRVHLAAPVRRLDLGPSLDGFRSRDWRSRTPGLTLLAENGRDYLAAEDGAPFDEARLRARPRAAAAKQYAAALPLGETGSVLYTGHFWPYTDEGVRRPVVFDIAPAHGGRVVAFGETAPSFEDWNSPYRHPAFVYAGPVPAGDKAGGEAGGVVDPSAPEWIGEEVAATAPRLYAWYARAIGRPPVSPPELFLAMGEGIDPGRLTAFGDALPGQFTVTLAGGGWAEPEGGARALLRRTLAHEAAHLWQQAARPRRMRDENGAGDGAGSGTGTGMGRAPAWIHEGAADALAGEAMAGMGFWDGAALYADRRAARATCAAELGGRPLAEAEAAGRWKAVYACGHALTLAAAAAHEAGGEGSVAGFLSAFIERAEADGGYDAALFFSMIEAGAGPDVARDARRFVFTAHADPQAELARLAEAARRAASARAAAGSGALEQGGGD